ncbi:MAG: hypothetical protein U5R48_18960 [Gammaproteobacteria bacterium]|nr:hypothetical protein [Gammaproteobacteria bacterium]
MVIQLACVAWNAFTQRSFRKAKEDFVSALKDGLAIARDESATREAIEIEEMIDKVANAKTIFSLKSATVGLIVSRQGNSEGDL